MVSAAELYDFANRHNIIVINGKIKKVPSFAICEGENCAIVIDESQIKSEIDEIIKMAHELGHCETGAFYDIHTLETRSRAEYRADRWAVKRLMPQEEVEQAFKQGYVEVWQLAEYFELPEDFIRRACQIYGYLEG